MQTNNSLKLCVKQKLDSEAPFLSALMFVTGAIISSRGGRCPPLQCLHFVLSVSGACPVLMASLTFVWLGMVYFLPHFQRTVLPGTGFLVDTQCLHLITVALDPLPASDKSSGNLTCVLWSGVSRSAFTGSFFVFWVWMKYGFSFLSSSYSISFLTFGMLLAVTYLVSALFSFSFCYSQWQISVALVESHRSVRLGSLFFSLFFSFPKTQ
jgi:hypothetical protein